MIKEAFPLGGSRNKVSNCCLVLTLQPQSDRMPEERYDIIKRQLLPYSKARLVLEGDHRLEALFQMNIM